LKQKDLKQKDLKQKDLEGKKDRLSEENWNWRKSQ
jgi:hypothetical protein